MANSNERKLQRMESFKRIINLGLVMICLGCEVAIFAYHWFTTFQHSVLPEYFRYGHVLEISVYAVVLLLLSSMYGGMRLGYLRNSEIIFSQVFATFLTDVFIYAQLSLMANQLFVPKVFIIMFTEHFAIVFVYINLANRIYRRIFPPRKLMLISGSHPTDEIISKINTRKDKYKIVKCMKIGKYLDKVCDKILESYQSGEMNAVMLWDVDSKTRNKLLKFCYMNSIRVYLMPKITDMILLGAEELHIFDSPLLLTREYKLTMEQRFCKRTIDIVCSLILLIITSPIMLLTAIAIKLQDGGPVLYKQVRCTINQREFKIMKFRSMRMDAEKDGKARLASKNDDRITPVGKFIRKCRIDELPQLINILCGDMSFIGPRPERPEIIKQYVEVMPEFVYRMKVKAGLAGFAQVYGKYNTTPYDKLKLDLIYIERYSLWMDIKLMLLTLKVLLWPDSTEGVESEQVTAFKEAHYKSLNEKQNANDDYEQDGDEWENENL